MPVPSGATAAEFALRRFGRETRLVERIVTVNTAPTLLLPNSPRRLAWLLQNRGQGEVAFSQRSDITFTNGFLIGPNGGFASMTVEEDGEAVATEVWGISSAASNTVLVQEVLGR